jgi:hypothetical protein
VLAALLTAHLGGMDSAAQVSTDAHHAYMYSGGGISRETGSLRIASQCHLLCNTKSLAFAFRVFSRSRILALVVGKGRPFPPNCSGI